MHDTPPLSTGQRWEPSGSDKSSDALAPAGSDKRALAVDRVEAPIGCQGNDLIHVLLGEDGVINEENVDAARDSFIKGGDKSAFLRERQFVVLEPQRRSRCSMLLLPAEPDVAPASAPYSLANVAATLFTLGDRAWRASSMSLGNVSSRRRAKPEDVNPWAGQACHEAFADRIPCGGEHDGNEGSSRRLSRPWRRASGLILS